MGRLRKRILRIHNRHILVLQWGHIHLWWGRDRNLQGSLCNLRRAHKYHCRNQQAEDNPRSQKDRTYNLRRLDTLHRRNQGSRVRNHRSSFHNFPHHRIPHRRSLQCRCLRRHSQGCRHNYRRCSHFRHRSRGGVRRCILPQNRHLRRSRYHHHYS